MDNNKKKTLVDEALLDIKVIQGALQKNTKEILRSTMHEEIDQIVKDYITEERGYEEEDIDDTEIDIDTDADTDVDADVDDGDDEVDIDIDSDETEADEESGDEELSAPLDGEEELTKPEENPINNLEMDYSEMDMTAASDEDVINVFKKLSAEDEVEVVSDNEVRITDAESGNEYLVSTGNKSTEPETEMGVDDIDIDDIDINGLTGEEGEESEEPVYEITLDEDIVRNATDDIETSMSGNMPSGDINGQKGEKSDVIDGDNLTGGFLEDDPSGKKDGHGEHVMETEDDEVNEEDVEESMAPTGTHTDANGKRGQMGGQRHQKPNTPRFNESISKRNFNNLLNVSKKLQTENKEVKKALNEFRKMLAESVVYNTNLTYMVKIITEHSTSKNEKKQIMKRFDDVKTLKESKQLFKTISSELGYQKTITESVNRKIEKSQGSGSSKELNESTAYVDESTKRIKDLINRVEK